VEVIVVDVTDVVVGDVVVLNVKNVRQVVFIRIVVGSVDVVNFGVSYVVILLG
jgi:hypothetical protein